METLYQIGRSLLKLLLRRGVRTSYSQDGEDILVNAYLRRSKGVYVDVGAYHPILYSNTYGLSRQGWKGVVVDPNPSMQPLYSYFRPRDRYVCAAVGSEEGSGTYYRFSDGAYNTLSSEDAQRAKQNKHIRFLGSVTVPVRPLRDILQEAKVTNVDFLSIDIEGMDIEALESYDWNMRPRVIAIEDNTFDAHAPETSAVFRYLKAKGYRLVGLSPRTLIFTQDETSRTGAVPVV